MKDIVIKFQNVTKTYKLYSSNRKRLLGIFFKNIKYKEKQAVNDVNFEIARGESVALFGNNGAGKSTILKMITGVAFPTSGEVEVNGRVSALLELKSGFDQEFTGRENIYLKGHILGLTDEEIASLEDEIVDFSELEDYIDQPVRTYSSGMKSRLGFAINVNIKPEILIVDEALSVGDTAFKTKCKEKVNEIIEKDNVTLLFVTHQVAVAEEFCTRGIVMKKGKLMFDGEVHEASEYYKEMVREIRRKKKKKLEEKLAQQEKTSE